MSDPHPLRPRAVVVAKTEDQLRGERDALLAELDGCIDAHCPRHWSQHEQLDTVRWLLGEAPA